MNEEPADLRYQTPQQLAGPYYEEMTASKEAAVRNLWAPDVRVRVAAILICNTVWDCGRAPDLLEACFHLAGSQAEDPARIVAIHMLGEALSLSKSPAASRFLADLVMDTENSAELRSESYWALREVQFGLGDTDFDMHLRGLITQLKDAMRHVPVPYSEAEVKAAITPPDGFPPAFWESAGEIDWEFVGRFASRK